MHFTDPFHVTTRVADNCSDGTLLLQVYILQLPCATSQKSKSKRKMINGKHEWQRADNKGGMQKLVFVLRIR